MSVKASTLEAMVLAGCTAEQIVAVVKAEEVADEEKRAHKRELARIRQQNKRARDAMSRNVTPVTRDTPHPPASDKEISPTPPKEINSTPLTPQTTLLGASAQGDFDLLQSKLVEAAGESGIQPHAALVVGPIAELVSAGVSLELDVLPTIRAVASRRTRPAGSWGYFIPAIREAYERRIGATESLPKPKPFDDSDAAWLRRLRFARDRKIWSSGELGPAPGAVGCRVPKHLLIDGDGVGWAEMNDRRTAA